MKLPTLKKDWQKALIISVSVAAAIALARPVYEAAEDLYDSCEGKVQNAMRDVPKGP